MTTKTSIQEAIEYFRVQECRTTNKAHKHIFSFVVEKLQMEFAEKNKQEIKTAFIDGRTTGSSYDDSKEYFKQKFTNK